MEKKSINLTHDDFVAHLNPFNFKTQNVKQRVYVQLVEELDEKQNVNITETYTVAFSMLTEEMLNKDIELFSLKTEPANYYCPFIFGFIATIHLKQYQEIKKLITIITKDNLNALIPAFLLHNNQAAETQYSIQIPGTIVFSASPFKYESGTLVITENQSSDSSPNSIKNEIENYLKVKDKAIHTLKSKCVINKENNDGENITIDYNSVKEPISKTFPEKLTSSTKIKIYNVGQANCVYLHKNPNQGRILIDVGIDKNWIKDNTIKPSHDYVSRNFDYINKIKPNIVILSHWDFDHILGVCLLKEKTFPDLWLAPDISDRDCKSVPIGALRLAYYLHLCNKLFMVGNSFDYGLFWENNCISIYKGQSYLKNHLKNNEIANNHGLIVTLKFNNLNLVFPGDCMYDAWPDSIHIKNHQYDFVMIPHHGSANSNLDTPTYVVNNITPKYAVCSYGIDNTHGHPDRQVHFNKLQTEYGYTILETPNYQCINISSKTLAQIDIDAK